MHQQVELVYYACDCGCGMTWRATKRSLNRYASRVHDPAVGLYNGFAAPKRRPGRPKKKRVEYTPEVESDDADLPESVAVVDDPVDLRELSLV